MAKYSGEENLIGCDPGVVSVDGGGNGIVHRRQSGGNICGIGCGGPLYGDL